MTAQVARPNHKVTRNRRPRAKLKEEQKQAIASLALANPNLTHEQVAELNNVERSTVTKILAQYSIDQSELREFKSQRGDILAGLQHKLLNSITTEDIKKAPMGSRVLAAVQLYDKERLERDLSTSNLASVHTDIAALRNLDNKDRE